MSNPSEHTVYLTNIKRQLLSCQSLNKIQKLVKQDESLENIIEVLEFSLDDVYKLLQSIRKVEQTTKEANSNPNIQINTRQILFQLKSFMLLFNRLIYDFGNDICITFIQITANIIKACQNVEFDAIFDQFIQNLEGREGLAEEFVESLNAQVLYILYKRLKQTHYRCFKEKLLHVLAKRSESVIRRFKYQLEHAELVKHWSIDDAYQLLFNTVGEMLLYFADTQSENDVKTQQIAELQTNLTQSKEQFKISIEALRKQMNKLKTSNIDLSKQLDIYRQALQNSQSPILTTLDYSGTKLCKVQGNQLQYQDLQIPNLENSQTVEILQNEIFVCGGAGEFSYRIS